MSSPLPALVPAGDPPPALRDATRPAVEQFLELARAADLESRLSATHLTEIARVFACSPYVAEQARRDPAAFLAMLHEADLGAVRDVEHHLARCAAWRAPLTSEEALRRELRRYRHRETVRIAWRDLLGLASLAEVLSELSALADALIVTAVEWLAQELSTRFGTPCDADGQPMSLIVIAMGKLGGGELNFSSDIDLMFVYRANGATGGGPRSLANQEYFDRLGKKLISVLNDTTAEGFVYRVDMRLRPFGDSGALTASFAALEQYYQLHGRDWERYALIKARAITGTEAERAALAEIARPFVYRRYLDFGAFEAVRDMKAMIDAEVARYGLERDIKRGAGGIREIEFIGQAFQLVRGGREPRLRLRQILPALRGCQELGLLEAADVVALSEAYCFLRVTEHRLQQVHDAQTQTLPDQPLEQLRIAWGLGYADWDAFAAQLARHRAAVRASFAALLLPRPAGDRASDGDEVGSQVWQAATNLDTTQELFVTAGFEDPPQAAHALAQLKDPRFLARLSAEARARLDRLMPPLVAACARQPQGALVLGRLVELVRAIARRSVYLALLADHGPALNRLVELCAASPWIAQQITRSPILLDELLDGRVLMTPPGRAELVRMLDEAIETADPGDLDRVMDVLRNFRHQQVLRVAACDLMADFPIAEVSNHLTWIAEIIVTKALALAWRDLVAKHGRPRSAQAGARFGVGFGVIAYGKLGGLELGYGSDLDLVFVHDRSGPNDMTDGAKPIANDVFFTRLAQRLIHLITTRTPAGQAYELDVRLRPSGSSGLLVTSLEAFLDYQQHSAWTWEHQALVRARGIAGTPETLERFAAIRRKVLRVAREVSRLQADIVEMREKMRAQLDRSDAAQYDLKQGLGGITDIEFMVQYACLRWAAQHQILTAYTDNLRLLDLVGDLGLLPRGDCRALHDAYFAYRAAIHRCALQEVDGLVSQAALRAERDAVAEVWRRTMRD
ncbi:MAG TPA: bifunctional [glutamate--ammonia ligase]-adenylyl-L-tyrosine phosphorylase/[glutamate--ammonia-ligase] adenylyltransferase [Gammaproteobacteria bacterium]|nr:bifunctional [glutamate--ammonia ligase]-adenylyl-L-tyrosine phosphorylase/[glutamate--ammonia-ligase] adenylyltransferase [Gammaproteobacteria bacterium]